MPPHTTLFINKKIYNKIKYSNKYEISADYEFIIKLFSKKINSKYFQNSFSPEKYYVMHKLPPIKFSRWLNLVFNTKNRTLVIDTLRLMPGDNLRSKLSLSLILPKVSFEGIDLEDFLFDNRLDLDKLNVVGSTISLEINSSSIRKIGR